MKNKVPNTGELSDHRSYIKAHKLRGIDLIKFRTKLWMGRRKAERLLRDTLGKKECYFGPFKGEFGHFLAHTLPFLMYLHSRGVKIHYCGMELHKPFMLDENGQSIIHEFIPLRDFFAEVPPSTNKTIPPPDVQVEIQRFIRTAESSSLPFWNIGDDFFYWFIYRAWLLDDHMKVYNLQKALGVRKERAAVVFPRSKGAKSSKNNGDPWDYEEVVNAIKPYFDKVYITGHPSQTLAVNAEGNVELCISADNSKILDKCARASLIITQHSGAVYLGDYTDTKVLIIYKGEPPIGSIQNTLKFKSYLGNRHALSFAYSLEDIIKFVKNPL